MHAGLGTLAIKAGKVVAAAVLVAAGLAVVAQPAQAAVPNPLYIQNLHTKGCLDQHYSGNTGTTIVFSIQPPCHSQGNQQWGFQWIEGNKYKIINHRTDGNVWCLSHPNNVWGSPVNTEHCVDAAKQVWAIEAADGGNKIINQFTGYCMYETQGFEVKAATCLDGDLNARWTWQPTPRS